jgi:hypothetical protein
MTSENKTEGGWAWLGRYIAVIVLSLILAAALGQMSLFEKTTLAGKLNASHIVQFLGYGAALVAFWLLGLRATIALQKQGGKWGVLQHLILPLVSLIVVSLAYSVMLLLLKPFLGATVLNVVNWTFIAAIVACAGWLIMATLNQSAPLTKLLTGKGNEPE